jgi:hypothetical protein
MISLFDVTGKTKRPTEVPVVNTGDFDVLYNTLLSMNYDKYYDINNMLVVRIEFDLWTVFDSKTPKLHSNVNVFEAIAYLRGEIT